METGIAYVSNRIGKIVTQQPPTTVRFDAETFKITNRQPVRFTRRPGSDWADDVQPYTALTPLLRLAGPPEILTRQAHSFLVARAAEFIDASRAAPTEADHRKVMKAAKAAVSAVAQLSHSEGARVGLPQVRAVLRKNPSVK